MVQSLLLAGLLVAAPPKGFENMQGTWTPTEGEFAGQALPAQVLQTVKLTIEGDKYTVVTGEGTDKGTLKLAEDKKPKHMDIIGTDGPNKGKTILAIYEVQGDSMRVCYELEGKVRPKEFSGKQMLLIKYERKK